MDTITPELLATLREELRAWTNETPQDDTLTHFRIEMFHQRLRAAEYGRPDAVQWALQWHQNVMQDRSVAQDGNVAVDALITARPHKQREDPTKAGNPRFQAWLDTVEDVDDMRKGWLYQSFILARVSEFEARHPVRDSNWHDKLTAYIRSWADARLAPRLRSSSAH